MIVNLQVFFESATFFIVFLLQVICYGQPIAAVIAETREIARNASFLVRIEYQDLKVILTQEVTCVD